MAPVTIATQRPRRSAPLARPPRCLWPGCGARLAHDHGAQVCAHHVRPSYVIAHDRRAAAIVLHLLLAAFPDAVDLCGVLRCTSHELQAPVNLLRRRGHVITGARRGYVYELAMEVVTERRRGGPRMEA